MESPFIKFSRTIPRSRKIGSEQKINTSYDDVARALDKISIYGVDGGYILPEAKTSVTINDDSRYSFISLNIRSSRHSSSDGSLKEEEGLRKLLQEFQAK